MKRVAIVVWFIGVVACTPLAAPPGVAVDCVQNGSDMICFERGHSPEAPIDDRQF